MSIGALPGIKSSQSGNHEQQQIQNLENTKKQLEDSIKRVKSDKNLSGDEKKKRVEDLEKQLKRVEEEISRLRQKKEEAPVSDKQKSEEAGKSNSPEHIKTEGRRTRDEFIPS